MDALRTASAPARVLLALGDAARDCDVRIGHGTGRVRLTLVGGRAVALAGVERAPLGDTLLALGELDLTSQRALLDAADAGSFDKPIGVRLVEAGAASAEAVRHALKLQLYRGIDALLRRPVYALHTQACAAPEARQHEVSVDLAAGVWASLIGIAEALPASVRAGLSGEGALVLGVRGERRVQGLLRAAHSGELAAALAAGQRGRERDVATPAGLLARASAAMLARVLSERPPPELLTLRAILRVLGTVAEPHAQLEDAYALLLRKRRELARNASASTLLDLPGPASAAHVRRALRRLAGKLHPDRFERSDDRLRAVSADVMRALAGAASALDAAASAGSTL